MLCVFLFRRSSILEYIVNRKNVYDEIPAFSVNDFLYLQVRFMTLKFYAKQYIKPSVPDRQTINLGIVMQQIANSKIRDKFNAIKIERFSKYKIHISETGQINFGINCFCSPEPSFLVAFNKTMESEEKITKIRIQV